MFAKKPRYGWIGVFVGLFSVAIHLIIVSGDLPENPLLGDWIAVYFFNIAMMAAIYLSLDLIFARECECETFMREEYERVINQQKQEKIKGE